MFAGQIMFFLAGQIPFFFAGKNMGKNMKHHHFSWPKQFRPFFSQGFLRLHVHCDSTRPGEDLGVCGDAPLPGWRGEVPQIGD